MKSLLKFLYQNTAIGHFLIQPIKKCYDIYNLYLIPDKIYIKKAFKKSFGYNINLDNPKTLNEKIQWLKLNDRTPLHTMCADKYLVREYVSNKIGKEYLVPLIMHTTDIAKISPENLPDFPVIIKTNNDSGTHYFIKNRCDTSINWEKIREKLKISLNRNYYIKTKEWQYKNIKPRIIIEELLLNEEGKIPEDYKVHVINQNVAMISTDFGRGTNSHSRTWYNKSWERTPFKWSSYYNKRFTDPVPVNVIQNAPRRLKDMIDFSIILASPFCYARVDWYEINGILYFGEITFHHDGGFAPIIPTEWDRKLGDMLKLPCD